MRSIIDFARALAVISFAIFLIPLGMLLAEGTISKLLQAEYRRVVEIGTGLVLSALWIWLYVLIRIRAVQATLRDSPSSLPISNPSGQVGVSLILQVEVELTQSSARVGFSFYVAVICIALGCTTVLSSLLLPVTGLMGIDNSKMTSVFGFFTTLVGTTLWAYYSSAKKTHDNLMSRAERLTSLLVILQELEKETNKETRSAGRKKVMDLLFALAMAKPGTASLSHGAIEAADSAEILDGRSRDRMQSAG